MRTIKIICLICLFSITQYITIVHAKDKKEIPPWMESVDGGGRSTYLIPKGAKKESVGNQMIVEAPNEYVARRIYEMEQFIEKRFKNLHNKQALLEKDLQAIKETLSQIKGEIELNKLEKMHLKEQEEQSKQGQDQIIDESILEQKKESE